MRDRPGRGGDVRDLRAEVGYEYDVVGEKAGRWYRERRGLPTAARARSAVQRPLAEWVKGAGAGVLAG